MFTLPGDAAFKMAPGQTFVELPDIRAKLRIGRAEAVSLLPGDGH